MTKHYATLDGLKRAAVKLKKRIGISHSAALEAVAREAGFADFHSAVTAFAAEAFVAREVPPRVPDPIASVPPVEIIEMSPELAALLKYQRDLDIAEAGPQAPEPSEYYRGVTIESRWSIAHELKTMRDIVDGLPDLVRARVASIWCDSNAQAWYSVVVRSDRWYDSIADDIRDAVLDVTSGFNGLLVEGDDQSRSFDPEWEGDDYDYTREEDSVDRP